MDEILDDLKYSMSRIRLKYDKESRSVSHFLCGMLRPLETSQGGVKKIGPLTLTYGNTIQAFLDGNYAGLQCTSMSLMALIQNAIHPKFTPRRINKILAEGGKLHTLLRDTIRLSDHVDGKIAVEDLPHLSYLKIGEIFGRWTEIKLQQECLNVFTSKLEGFEDFLTIKEYLQKWLPLNKKRMGFIMSIGYSSYAVILKKNGKMIMFDSHGHLKVNGEIIKEKAATLKFPSLDSFEDFITDMYGLGEQAIIAPVSVTFNDKAYFDHTVVIKKAKQLVNNYKPVFPATQRNQTKEGSTRTIALGIPDDGETCPYIGLMGSRC